ncbi:SpoVR family protein [Salsuginibacillus kocurii]|uniref:SpoVR family protein n=1 Tax=Salsuginibacillus kocurii TaxID=427078 RepID=UPI0003648B4D|nr:SpoVR family protein [Salsuginibacillus kocurii]
MNRNEKAELERSIGEITELAEHFGLDFYPMRYEVCPADMIYTFGAYGMPARYSHWSFGKQFYKMKLYYDLGLSKIYELVINSNPCYAFLLDSNTLVQNKLIVAHVLGHSDFFKNNIRFQQTREDMIESMSAASERLIQYEHTYGKKKVESFLDAVLSIQEHIDPSLFRTVQQDDSKKEFNKPGIRRDRLNKDTYDDLWDINDESSSEEDESLFSKGTKELEPEKDVLLFIEENSRDLEEWQRDVLTIVREEMLYFWPQLETKIMNEGWASFWHARIMRELDLTPDESIEFASLHANVTQPQKGSINPYHLGLIMFEDIEKRYNNPSEEMKERGVKKGSGLDKLFEVRHMESDVSFIRNYLTNTLIRKEDLFLYEKKGQQYEVVTKDGEEIRRQLMNSRLNGGFPYLTVVDGDYMKAGELKLRHHYEGIELDLLYVEKTLPYVYELWGRPVHLTTVINEKETLFSCDGRRVYRKYL